MASAHYTVYGGAFPRTSLVEATLVVAHTANGAPLQMNGFHLNYSRSVTGDEAEPRASFFAAKRSARSAR